MDRLKGKTFAPQATPFCIAKEPYCFRFVFDPRRRALFFLIGGSKSGLENIFARMIRTAERWHENFIRQHVAHWMICSHPPAAKHKRKKSCFRHRSGICCSCFCRQERHTLSLREQRINAKHLFSQPYEIRSEYYLKCTNTYSFKSSREILMCCQRL